ncbi:hypothetical protein N7509_011980 [Penicillium cosmopolitanum]|uniref:Uncharacterized protein n=1 Tax=Penicillium cosmopolitanum TaxID=1131564 RepID=A0A9W9SHT6_9EURO|nr:uncharacterized protein N7509_011980 [Penicillium cosmopolitanum]KAJ5378861.1 hypothetical protein N7509_011980 [Penicillium cosmopolitanum]
MHRNSLVQLAFGLTSAALVSATNDPNFIPSLNFRPDNVTSNRLYDWVGSYYNGTTSISVKPFSGVSKQEIGSAESNFCPNLEGKEVKAHYDSILALTERSSQNAGNNSVNVFYTLWDEGFDFSTLKSNATIADYPWSYGLFSSDPAIAHNETNIPELFNLTVRKTEEAPYDLSGLLGDSYYNGSDFAGKKTIIYNMTTCNGTKDIPWDGVMLTKKLWSEYDSNVTYPNPSFDVQFDDETANLTLSGYIMSYPSCGKKATFCEADVLIYAEIEITFSGTIDIYHSDELETDGSTPKWERTVGFGNGTQISNGSSRREHYGVLSLLASAFALSVTSLYI